MANAHTGPLRYAFISLGLAVAITASWPALAQTAIEKSVEVQLLQSAIGTKGFLTVDSASVPAHKTFGLGLMISHQRAPVSLLVENNGELRQTVVPVSQQATAELTGAMGLFDRLQVGF